MPIRPGMVLYVMPSPNRFSEALRAAMALCPDEYARLHLTREVGEFLGEVPVLLWQERPDLTPGEVSRALATGDHGIILALARNPSLTRDLAAPILNWVLAADPFQKHAVAQTLFERFPIVSEDHPWFAALFSNLEDLLTEKEMAQKNPVARRKDGRALEGLPLAACMVDALVTVPGLSRQRILAIFALTAKDQYSAVYNILPNLVARAPAMTTDLLLEAVSAIEPHTKRRTFIGDTLLDPSLSAETGLLEKLEPRALEALMAQSSMAMYKVGELFGEVLSIAPPQRREDLAQVLCRVADRSVALFLAKAPAGITDKVSDGMLLSLVASARQDVRDTALSLFKARSDARSKAAQGRPVKGMAQ